MKIGLYSGREPQSEITVQEAVEGSITYTHSHGAAEQATEVAENCAKAIAKLVARLPECEAAEFIGFPFVVQK